MKKTGLRGWIENNNLLMIFSVCIAVLIWVVVAMTIKDTIRNRVTSIPVDISGLADEFTALGLNPVEISDKTVAAMVEGDRIAISSLTAGDLRATIQLEQNVSEPGSYYLTLVPMGEINRRLITGIEYSPDEIQVKFDRLISKTFPLTATVNGFSFPPDYIKGSEIISPSQVTIKGPQAEIDKIKKCVIVTELTEPLDKTYVEDLPVMVLDARGDEIDLEANQLSIDYSTSRLEIEMLQITGLDIRFMYTNIPNSFPTGDLEYRLSTDVLEVGAPVEIASKNNEIVVGHIDIRSITPENTKFTFKIEVPSSYQSMSDVNSVTVDFDNSDWGEAIFNAKGIEILNIPLGYDVKALSETIYNIRFVGSKDIIETMTADDIVMEIDLSEKEVSGVGQYQFPVKINAPTKGLVWAVGDEYSVVIQVEEKKQ